MLRFFKPNFAVFIRKYSDQEVSNSKKWLRKTRKKKVSDYWKRISASSPFSRTNPGVSGELKALEMDPEDPGMEITDIPSHDFLDSTLEKFGDEISVRRQTSIDPLYKQLKTKSEVKHILGLKSVMPKPKDPILLTHLEKEAIRYLHDSDPNSWSPEILADSFPSADKIVIKKVLKNRPKINLDKIALHDRDVASNWKLLAKGELSIRPELKRHIVQGGNPKFKQPPSSIIPKEFQEKLNKKQNSELERTQFGYFGSIIANYESAVKTLNKPPDEKVIFDEAVEVTNLFDPDALNYGIGGLNESHPKRDTALLNTSIDFKKEKSMSFEHFKNTVLFKKSRKRIENLSVSSPEEKILERRYFEWLNSETLKDDWSSGSKVEKLDVDEIIKENKKD